MKPKRSPVEIYQSNYVVSTAAAQMTENIGKLAQAGVIETAQARHRIAVIEQVRALTSMDVGENMNTPETVSARTAERKQFAIERKWKKATNDSEQKKTTSQDIVIAQSKRGQNARTA